MNFIKRATENISLINENKVLKNKLFHTYDIIGSSENINSIKEQIQKISHSESRVFISGPTGSALSHPPSGPALKHNRSGILVSFDLINP